MTAGWVAATTRGRSFVDRLSGPAGARALAEADWPGAQAILRTTFYGSELPADPTRAETRRAAAAATMWQLRVLAGWFPPGQGSLARLFAAPMEIANIESHLTRLEGRDADPPIPLGALASASRRVAAAGSADQVRHILATSVWGDPGGSDRPTIALGLRLAWARRLSLRLPAMAAWAGGGAATLVAREQFGFGRAIKGPSGGVADRLLGRHWRRASTIPELARLLPKSASWPLVAIEDPSDLWRAEAKIADRVRVDATRLVSSGAHDKSTAAATMALLLVDLWQVQAAVEVAGRGPTPAGVFDAVA